MSPQRRTPYPAAATGWMIGGHRLDVLDLGSGAGGFAAMLADDGHRVRCLDRSAAELARTVERLGRARVVVGQAEALPFSAARFDVVTAAQTLHRFAPGLALPEIARVLRPGGHLAVAYNTRDDTVPWVRRLAARLQQVDPTAMAGDYGVSAVDHLEDSVYFRQVSRRNFRNWVPIDRAGLLAMVERRPATATLSQAQREELLSDVADLYAGVARPPEPLLLPFQTSCWRAEVDHRELKLDHGADEALEIRLGF